MGETSEEQRRQRHLLKFFVEDLFNDVLDKNITVWSMTRSDFLQQAHAAVPSEYKFNENVARALVVALEFHRDTCDEESRLVVSKIKDVQSSEKAHVLHTAVQEMSSRFSLRHPPTFIIFLAAVASTAIDICEIGEKSLIPTMIIAVESCISGAALGNTNELFRHINDSTAYFLRGFNP